MAYVRLSIKKISCPAGSHNFGQSGGRNFFFFSLFSFCWYENIVQFWKKNFFFAKMKKKVFSRTYLSHPAAKPKTELFSWTASHVTKTSMSHVDFKKCPCSCVDFRKGPCRVPNLVVQTHFNHDKQPPNNWSHFYLGSC